MSVILSVSAGRATTSRSCRPAGTDSSPAGSAAPPLRPWSKRPRATALPPLLRIFEQAEAIGAEWRLLSGGRSRGSMAFLDELARYGDRVIVRPQDEYGLLDLPSVLDGTRL